MKELGIGHVTYEGATTEKKRTKAVVNFQNDPNYRVFVANTVAAKTGLTLTAATIVIFLDLCWTPADHSQSEDRAYRIGQKGKVKIIYLIAAGTIEEKIYALLESKRETIEAFYQSNDVVMNMDDSVEAELMESLVTEGRLGRGLTALSFGSWVVRSGPRRPEPHHLVGASRIDGPPLSISVKLSWSHLLPGEWR